MTCTQKLAEKIPNTGLRLLGFSDRSARASLAQVRADAIASDGMLVFAVSHARPQIPRQAPFKFSSYASTVGQHRKPDQGKVNRFAGAM